MLIEPIGTQLEKEMSLKLEGMREECPFTWTFNRSFPANASLISLEIATDIQCNIKGPLEQVVINFPTTPTFQDGAANNLQTSVLVATLRKRMYIPKGQAEAVATAGGGMAVSTIVTFIVALIPAVLQYLYYEDVIDRLRWGSSGAL
jgi:hypothetical protein